MQTTYENKFLKEHRLHYHALRALVHQKHEIRINFSRSHTYQLLQVQLNHPLSTHMTTISLKGAVQYGQKSEAHSLRDQFSKPGPSQFSSRKPHSILQEVIHRSRNRLAALGQSQNKPVMRNSTMSRTYRRKKSNHNRPIYQSSKQFNPNNPEIAPHPLPTATISTFPHQQHTNNSNMSLDLLAREQSAKMCFSRPRFPSSLPIKHNRRQKVNLDNQKIGDCLQSFITKSGRHCFYKANLQDKIKGQTGAQGKMQSLGQTKGVEVWTASNQKISRQIGSIQTSKRKMQPQLEARGESSCRPWSSHKDRDSQLKDQQNSLLATPLK